MGKKRSRNLLQRRIEEVEKRINIIQKSTKTYFSEFAKIHNLLRVKLSWYELWHLRPRVTMIHVVILATYIILALIIIFFNIFI